MLELSVGAGWCFPLSQFCQKCAVYGTKTTSHADLLQTAAVSGCLQMDLRPCKYQNIQILDCISHITVFDSKLNVQPSLTKWQQCL